MGMRGRGMYDAKKESPFMTRFDRCYFANYDVLDSKTPCRKGNKNTPTPPLELKNAQVVGMFPTTEDKDGKRERRLESLSCLPSVDFILPNAWHPSDHLPLVVDFCM